MNSEQRFFIMHGMITLLWLSIIGIYIWTENDINILGIAIVGIWFMSEYFHRVITNPLERSLGRLEIMKFLKYKGKLK